MLEALLEKFIINYLGRYFSGLDKKKIDIGVWKGDIAIENLALNHDLLTTANLPIEVVYSYIARLALKVPWTKLSSSSVELTVEDVFLLVRIKSRDEWKDQDFNTLDCKYGILKKCADTVTEKLASLAKKPSQKSGPPGHIEKILIKIIDNLQITLKNVHIRVECADNTTFSAGIHLANLKIMTTDEGFSNLKYQKFEATSTGRVVRKLAKISSFQIYWNSKPSEYWHKTPNPDSLYLKFKTFNLLEIESYRIILLAADLRVIINEKGGSLMNKVDSKYTVELDIPLLDVKLTTSQIKDVLNFLANMDNYKSKKALSLEDVRYGIFRPAERIQDAKPGPEHKAVVKKWWMYAIRAAWHKSKLQSGKYVDHWGAQHKRKLHEHTFKTIFWKVYSKKLDPNSLTKHELTLFEEIMKGYYIGTLKAWTEGIVLKEAAAQQQTQKTKATDEDFLMLRRFLSSSLETDFKESEIKTLEKAILESISSDNTDIINKQIQRIKEKAPQYANENLVKFKFQVILQKGSIYLNNNTIHSESKSTSSLIFKDDSLNPDYKHIQGPSYTLLYEGMEFDINFGTEKMDLRYKLDTLNLSANLRGVGINIADVTKKKTGEPFLLFYMDQPVRKGSAPVTISLGIGAIHFIYYPFVIYEFQNLLSLDSFEEKGKNVAMRELRSIGKRSKTKVEEYMQSPPEMIIDIFIESPMVTVPFPLWRETYLAEAVSEILVLNLGTLRISNHEDSTAAVEREMQKFAPYNNNVPYKTNKEFEETNISLKSINLTYYPHSFHSPVAMLNTLTKMQHTGGLRDGHPSGEGFTIIENFSLNINISKLKKKLIEDNNPEVKVSGKIYDISVNLSAKAYELLLLLAQRENDTRARVFLKEQKTRILNNSSMKGYISYQNPTGKGWKRHFLIVSGSNLYFYESEAALKPAFNLNINGSKVVPPAENTKQKNSFSVIIHNNKHSISCSDKSSMTKWMNEIRQKATEFAPAFDGSFSFEEKLVKKKKLPKVTTMISLQVERFKVTLKSNQNEDWMTLLLGNIFCTGNDSATEFDLRLSLESLDLYESHGKFPSDHLRTLIKSQDDRRNGERLIDVQVVTQKEKNPEGGNIDKLINFKFGQLAVYWKPKLILELQNYFKKPAPSRSSLESYGGGGSFQDQQGEYSTFSIAFGQQVNAQEMIEDTEEDNLEDTINLIMDFSAGRITLFLEFNSLYLASIDLIDYQMNIRVTPEQLDVQGSLSQVKIHDMTQYPSTLTKKEDFAHFSREEMFTTDKNESAVKFSFLDFSKNTRLNNLNKRKKLLNLDFSSFNLIYFQQPILRLINYFLESIMGILIKDSPIRTIPEALKTLESPSFTEMRVTINRPKIRLKPIPNFSYYYDIDLGFIVLTNTHEKVTGRVIESSSVEEVWVEKYAIRFSDMVFWTIHGTATQQVSEFFNLQMEVERMIFNTEYQTIYKNSKFNKEIQIKGHFTPIIMSLSKLNYLLLLSMLFSNVSFDDKKEAYFTQSAKPGTTPNPTTIRIDLHFDSLDMLLLDDNNHPLLSLGIIHKSITITRDAKKEMMVKLKGDKLFGNYYMTNISKGIVNEISYMSNVMFTKDYIIRRDGLGGPNKKKVMSIWRAYSEIFDNIKSLSKQRFSDSLEHDSNKLEMVIEMKNNNEKNIKIELSKLKFILNLRLTRIFSDFFGYSEKVQVFTPIIEKGLITARKSIPQLNVDIKFSDCLILLSSQAEGNTIALKGKFSFMYVRNSYEESELYQKPPSRVFLDNNNKEEIKEITMNKNEEPDDVIEGEHKITSKWMFDAQPMEIIMGALGDLIQLPNVRQNVTSIFLPFNIFIISENAVLNEVINKQTNERVFLNRSLRKFNFELANIRVTYKDFMNLIKIFQYQLECYNDYSDTINSEKNAQVFPKPDKNLNKDDSISQTPFQQTEYGFQGINFVLINDVFGAHSPLLDFNIKDSEVIMLKKGTSTMTSSLSLNVNFFNPFIGRWEPIIEPLTLYIETFQAEPPSSQRTISIESDHGQAINPVYINISQEMITIVKRDLKLCMEEYRRLSKLNELESITENDEENIQENIITPKLPASDYNRNDTSPEKRPNFFGYSVVSDKMSKIGMESDIYSPYAILNRIGQSCFVEPEFDDEDIEENGPNPTLQTYHCINGRVCGIDLENKTHSLANKYGKGNEFRQLSQKVRIEIPLKQNYSFIINNVELNQVSQKKFKLSYKNPATKKEDQYEVLSYVELVGTKRILTLSSINKIVNCTSFQINAKIKHEEKSIEELINSGGEFFIPFTFNTFGISLQVDNIEWPPFVMNDQLHRPDIAQQFKLGNKYFVIRRDFSIKQMNVFVIEPPFILRNFLPSPLTLDLSDPSNDKNNHKVLPVTLAENDVYQVYDFKFECPLTATVRIENFMPAEGVLLNVKNKNTDNKITLKDFAKQTCLLNLYATGEPNGCKTLYIYTDLYIKNQTPYNLIFEYKGDGQVTKFARQNMRPEKMRDDLSQKIIFGQTEKKYQRIYISLRDDPAIKTKKISIQSIGGNCVSAENKETFLHSSGAAESEGKLSCYDFGVEINMVNHLKSLNDERKYFLYSKVITVYPRYVIVNRTNYSLSLIQPETMYSSPFIVKPNERTHFYWKSSKLEKFVKLLLVEPTNKTETLDWKWSGSIDLTTIGDQHFLCVKAKGNEVKFLKATTIVEKSILYTVIEEQNDAENLGYRIVNDLSDCTITVQQDILDAPKEKLLSMYKTLVPESQQKGFSWQEPLLKKEIKCEVKFRNSQYETLIIKCEPDKKVNTVQNYPLRSNGRNLNTKITLKVFMDGNTKVIRFAPFTRQEEEQPKTEIEKFSLTMKIGVIGLSIISTIDNIRKEVIFAGVKDLEFAWLESNENRTFHMRVKHLQVDNNSSSHAQYPVLLTPYNKIAAGKPESEHYFIDGLITFSLKDKKSIILPQVKLELSKPVLRIEDSFIDAILKLNKSFQTDMMKTMNTVKYSTTSIQRNNVASPLRHFGRSSTGVIVLYDWQIFNIDTNSKSIYVEDFGLSYIEVLFSFKMNYDPFEKSDFSVTKLVSNALGVAITNIENAPIRLKGLEITGVLDSPKRFIEKLGKHYKQELIKSVFTLLGSVEILGNPIGLFNHITTGMIDFIEKPREGFIRGPLEGGMGIVKGTHSLFRNTILGTFGTVNKITGSVAAGISTLSLDQEFIKRREGLRKKKAHDVVDGLGQGLYALYDGINQGVVGFFTKPFEEASRSGFTGFLKGSYMGISGVIVKPMIGLLDAASKTAEGFKSMAETNDEGLLSTKERIPRPFYGKQMMFRNYIPYDAEILFILTQLPDADISKYCYIDAYPMRPSKENSYILNLVIFSEAIGLFSLKMNRFVWIAEYDWVERVELNNIFITFTFRKELPKTTISTYTVINSNLKVNELIMEQIRDLIKKS